MNIYAEVQSLQKSPIDSGGLCKVFFFKIEDVQTWPSVDPVTGIIIDSIVFKAGKGMLLCQAADKGRSYEEETLDSPAGPYTLVTVNSVMGGNNTANILSLDAMKHHQWGLILDDRGGYLRLVGSADAGAKFNYKGTSGDHQTASRKVDVKWQWEYPSAPAIYQSSRFTITIGPVTISTGKISLILRFRVGDPGAPMNDADTILTDSRLANKNLLVIVDNAPLNCDDGSGAIDWTSPAIRHYKKLLSSDTIEFIGGVVDREIVEIYAFE